MRTLQRFQSLKMIINMKVKHVTSLVISGLLLCGCAIQETAIETQERAVKESPILVIASDSLQVMRINSKIQSSYESILVGNTAREGDSFVLRLSEEQARELGVPEAVLRDYKAKLDKLNK